MTSRQEREQEQYDRGLDRGRYERVLRHTRAYWNYEEAIRDAMAICQGRIVLEIGSHSWSGWLEKNHIYPAALHAINISEAELEKGRSEARHSVNKPVFHLMDAHALQFADESFDVVYGSSILHHLNVGVALREIARVLKGDGRVVFREPLGINPIAKLIRRFTPSARTVDEQPLGFRELALFKRHFEVELRAGEFLSVPLGVLSGLVLSRPRNPLTYTAYVLDKQLLQVAPCLKYWYRQALITGRRRSADDTCLTETGEETTTSSAR